MKSESIEESVESVAITFTYRKEINEVKSLFPPGRFDAFRQ